MKKIYTLLFLSTLLVFNSCDKEVMLNQQLKQLTPASLDENAGSWSYILMSGPTQFNVAAPAITTSDAYLTELQNIKNIQAGLTKEQRNSIAYWSSGGVLRWNEILRGLVSRFNLPPAPLANGNYPAPDAENPFGDPNFPFANPPYAARAYSYVAAAQYDALKSAWHYKFQFNRPAPYNVDSSIESLMAKSTLPGYPSEDAVMSGVTAEILKLMFPAAVEEITLRAAEQRNAALWSGKASASDISAGLQLGKDVAALFTARARTDGTGTSGGNKTQWDMLKANAESRGEIAWKSLEVPPRPPMLPFFGLRTIGNTSVGAKMWMMTPAQLESERPAAPPLTGPTLSEKMREEVVEVKWYTEHVTRERLAIVHKWADGVGTYTPPGHWDEIASHHIEAANFSEVRAARTLALLNMALHDAAVGCWEAKFYYFNPRPTQLDPSIKTTTGIPNFPAYPSGHSTFSAAASSVLSYLFPQNKAFYEDQAMEAAMSRLYGGIHFRTDCMVGLDHGNRIASHTLEFAKSDGADD